jgi:hypothetical protein
MLSPSVRALPHLGHAVSSEALGAAPSEDEPSTSPLNTSSTLNTLSTSQRFNEMLARYFMSWPCAARAQHQIATPIADPHTNIQPRECKLLSRKLDAQAEHDISMQMRADTAHEHTRQAEPPLLDVAKQQP